jgi:hypothetical protein
VSDNRGDPDLVTIRPVRGRRPVIDLAPFHQWIVFVHIIGVFLFLLAHGTSAAVLLRLRSERDPAAVLTLVDLSARTINVMGVGLAIWFLGGIAAGFSGNYWTSGRLWIWASLLIAVAVIALMTPLGRGYVDRVRIALGVDPKAKAGQPLRSEIDAAALDAAIRSGRPALLASLGLGAVAVLTWLMMFKPF